MDLEIREKVALVCASSKGLGKAVAESMAAEGAKVAICARNPGALESAAQEIQLRTKCEVLAIAADLTDPSQSAALVDAVIRKWNTVHILVNNAGGPPNGPFEDHTMDRWRAAVELNFMSAVRMCSLVIPYMKKQRWGRIINITSIAAKQPVDGLILSNAVRAGVLGLGKSLANELAPHNILVNNVCPGYTRTDRVVDLASAEAQRQARPIQEIYGKWERLIPVGRMAAPEEFAALVTFLASERASYITGATIPVDGGYIKGLG
jgi:3-oxoacyl-[acyl-carrier protein] reductase